MEVVEAEVIVAIVTVEPIWVTLQLKQKIPSNIARELQRGVQTTIIAFSENHAMLEVYTDRVENLGVTICIIPC